MSQINFFLGFDLLKKYLVIIFTLFALQMRKQRDQKLYMYWLCHAPNPSKS